jgi:hypothetical protein
MSSKQRATRLRPIDPEYWTVENELPDPLPVSTAELDAIERYFGQIVDAVFAERPRSGSPPLTSKGSES